MWDLPGLGIEPMSPALAGRSLTTGHQGSPKRHTLSLQTEAHKEGAVAVVQLLSRVQLCDPMDCITPGFLVFYHLLEFAQTCPLSW